ncbi:hypothetical protein ONS95_012118 [Cadophora gregata]|uniref:uncharacterized protein n=1 Tax=Cadophora gregata TaxID=51156 RepID=UPI0026DC412B|nr:uncharacterized protein ONS95_012118 [Cadophora gregata]KAK0117792.1 hypothetical protein ONS95_012118 [Cadophora gregata]KAK0122844.1 hypothetical protein ONS96_009874 [Cadophora gregata f. sp. sojae]
MSCGTLSELAFGRGIFGEGSGVWRLRESKTEEVFAGRLDKACSQYSRGSCMFSEVNSGKSERQVSGRSSTTGDKEQYIRDVSNSYSWLQEAPWLFSLDNPSIVVVGPRDIQQPCVRPREVPNRQLHSTWEVSKEAIEEIYKLSPPPRMTCYTSVLVKGMVN